MWMEVTMTEIYLQDSANNWFTHHKNSITDYYTLDLLDVMDRYAMYARLHF